MTEMMESTVNAEAAAPVVEEQVAGYGGAETVSPEQQEAAEPAWQTMEAPGEAGGSGSPEQGGRKPQSREQNAAFAAARRQAEAEARAAREETRRLMEVLGAYGYKGATAGELADTLEAQRRSITVEQLRTERAAEQERLRQAMEASPEMRQLRAEKEALNRWKMERDFADDLAAIKKHNPKEEAGSVMDFGRDFMAARAMGVDVITAYELAQAKKAREKKPVPPDVGGIGSSSGIQKDFYTSDELDRLTSRELDDPKVFARAMASLHKLK